MPVKVITEYKEPALWISRNEGIVKCGNTNNWVYINMTRGVFLCFNSFNEALSNVLGSDADIEVYTNKVVIKSGNITVKEYGNWT